MPKDNYGDRDRYASDALRNILPKHWKFKSPRDSDSGSERCQDWVIEILDEEREWTGAEFTIQNKTDLFIHKSYVSIDLSVYCVIYLLDKITRPVMLHAYDMDADISYWLWLSKWERVGERQQWRNQKEVTIQIPKSNVLTETTVSEIQDFVREAHFKASIRQQVDTANQSNPDFTFSSPEFVGNNIFSIAQPKHDGAQFTFTVDEKGDEAIRRALEKGHVVQFPLLSDTMPSPHESVIGEDSEVFVILFPLVPDDRDIPLRLIFLDAEDNVILEHKYVPFTMVRPGSVEKEFKGQPPNSPIVYSIVTRSNESTGLVDATLKFHCAEPQNPIVAKTFCDLYNKFLQSERVRIIHLESDKQLVEFELQNLPEIHEKVKRYIDAVYLLQQKHNKYVPVPTELNDVMLFSAEFCSQILAHGKSHWVFNRGPVTWKTPVAHARNIVDTFKQKGFVQVATEPSHIEISIYNTKIDLGMLRSIYFVTQINNLAAIEANMASLDAPDDGLITIEFEIDSSKSFTEKV